MWSQLAEYNRRGQRYILATVTDTGGSTPRKIGAQMIITSTEIQGTIGGGAIELQVIEAARARLSAPPVLPVISWVESHLTHDLGMCCGGHMKVMLHEYTPAPQLWIFGAGHVGTALAQTAAVAGFKIHIVDERAEWASEERFKEDVDVICEDPEHYLRAHPLDPSDYAVIVTHDHALDQRILELLARAPLSYLGLIGSRGKWGRFLKRLRARAELTELDRVRCPMGVDIGAQTPGEIAVSVAAELIQRRQSLFSS